MQADVKPEKQKQSLSLLNFEDFLSLVILFLNQFNIWPPE